MSFAIDRLAALSLVLFVAFGAEAQQRAKADFTAVRGSSTLQQLARVPGSNSLWQGFNAGVTMSGVHDSAMGWYTVATPAISYSLTPHIDADASISIFPSRNVLDTRRAMRRGAPFRLELGQLGDTYLGIHATFNPRLLRNTTTASFTFPTGDRSDGLGAGEFTFDFSDRIEHYYKRAVFLLDAGAGNSSGLFNRMVTKDYNSVGALTHFQEGVFFWLPRNSYIQYVAYQQVPIGGGTRHSDDGWPGLRGLPNFSGSGIGRDFGLTTYMAIPLSAHMMLSSYYSRSFNQPRDTVSMGVTYMLHRTSGSSKLSLVDRALREAEQDSEQPAAQ